MEEIVLVVQLVELVANRLFIFNQSSDSSQQKVILNRIAKDRE